MDVALELLDLPISGRSRAISASEWEFTVRGLGGERFHVTTSRTLGEDHRVHAGKVAGKRVGGIGDGGMESYSFPPNQ